jgi:hypothetical protein
MTQGDQLDDTTAYQPGDAVWVFVLGTWHPAEVVGTVDAGQVLARYRRADGELAERTFPRSAVVEGALP